MTEEFNRRLERSRERVANMDAVDGYKERDLSTILEALRCGLNAPETEAHFDAFVMLEDVVTEQDIAETRREIP